MAVQIYLDGGGIVVDNVKYVDKAEENGDQQSHPTSYNLGKYTSLTSAF